MPFRRDYGIDDLDRVQLAADGVDRMPGPGSLEALDRGKTESSRCIAAYGEGMPGTPNGRWAP